MALLAAVSLTACARIMVLADPLTPEEHIQLGVSYESRGELDAAIDHYVIAAQELPLAHLYIGNVYFLKNEPARAENHYLKVIEHDPENTDAMNNLAWLYYTERKNLDTAAKLARDAKIQRLIDSDCSGSSCP
jgi:tetratricopeptide (TPR) repeat protein